jgi:hypothetical protein
LRQLSNSVAIKIPIVAASIATGSLVLMVQGYSRVSEGRVTKKPTLAGKGLSETTGPPYQRLGYCTPDRRDEVLPVSIIRTRETQAI